MTFGSCDTGRRAPCGDNWRSLLHRCTARGPFPSCCARILLSVLQTSYTEFPWLQPKSPVVEVVVENGRGPDPPDARAVVARAPLGSGRPGVAREARGSRRAAESHLAAEAGNQPQAAKAEGANLRRGNRAAVRRRAKEPDERAVEERAPDASAQAVAVLVVERSLPWLG
jgi:hypothetical protein